MEFDQQNGRLWETSSILQIIPERMYHKAKATCVVRWQNEADVRQWLTFSEKADLLISFHSDDKIWHLNYQLTVLSSRRCQVFLRLKI